MAMARPGHPAKNSHAVSARHDGAKHRLAAAFPTNAVMRCAKVACMARRAELLVAVPVRLEEMIAERYSFRNKRALPASTHAGCSSAATLCCPPPGESKAPAFIAPSCTIRHGMAANHVAVQCRVPAVHVPSNETGHIAAVGIPPFRATEMLGSLSQQVYSCPTTQSFAISTGCMQTRILRLCRTALYTSTYRTTRYCILDCTGLMLVLFSDRTLNEVGCIQSNRGARGRRGFGIKCTFGSILHVPGQ